VTFTNKAANEMKERIEGLIGNATRGMWVGTFHAMCARMLRASGQRVGVDPNFVVFDTADQQTLIKDSLEELNLDPKQFRPSAILSIISNAKNELIDPRNLEQTAKGYVEEIAARVYTVYQKKLRLNRACDFDDLIFYAVELVEQHPEVADQYQERFQHVLVDEYQDINFAQYKLVENLARKHRNICGVGDDDQSIYSWRGADVRLILQFEHDYPDALVIKLEQNYRSTQTILDAAYQVIRKNQHRSDKRLWTTRKGGAPVVLQDTANELEEAHYVVTRVRELTTSLATHAENGGRRYSDFAVLYRVNAQSRVLEEEFVKFRVPFRLVGAVQFYQRKEIKDVVAYLKVLYNPHDTVSLRRIINVPTRGIGQKTLELLDQEATRRECSVMEVLRLIALQAPTRRRPEPLHLSNDNDSSPEEGATPERKAPLPSQLLTPRAANGITDFVRLLALLLESFGKSGSLTQLTQGVLTKTGYQSALEEERSLEGAERLENLKEFLSATQEFDKRKASESEGLEDLRQFEGDGASLLGGFLESIALVSDLDSLKEAANGGPDSLGAVTLMTLHAAKGLEFPVVFMVGMEENVFPHSRSKFDVKELEEERRLCYVGLTRAKEEVYLTYAHRRTLYGLTTDSLLSQFVRDIPQSLRVDGRTGFDWNATGRQEIGKTARETSATPVANQPSTPSGDREVSGKTPPPRDQYRIGDKVLHTKWGEGIVVRVPSSADQQDWIEVAFPRSDIGIKKLMLDYAPLEKL
ncbi:MAG: UvrD-helicase domain-containing protein, partial [Armatimonadetes bacterium]|nr:UvrD-helicase domain-containing protein [Armatimonadota bacterium]